MVIFVQATALRYDAYLDFEFLVTGGIYWSMLETGLGFIAANSIVAFKLVTKRSIPAFLRNWSSIKFSKSIRDGSQRELQDSSFQLKRKGFTNMESGSAASRSLEGDMEGSP